jgi:hypothetical protein
MHFFCSVRPDTPSLSSLLALQLFLTTEARVFPAKVDFKAEGDRKRIKALLGMDPDQIR